MEHNFTHSGHTVGVEEELMILDGTTLDLRWMADIVTAIGERLATRSQASRSSGNNDFPRTGNPWACGVFPLHPHGVD